MKKFYYSLLAVMLLSLVFFQKANAQNTSPYWSLAGNSNATTTSKFGTTNNVSLRFFAGNAQRMLIGYSSGNVSIGTTSLNARLTVNAPTGTAPLLGQINGTTKLYAASNGGLTIGSGSTPLANGLRVEGIASMQSDLYIQGKTNIVSGLTIDKNDGSDAVQVNIDEHMYLFKETSPALVVESDNHTIGGSSAIEVRGGIKTFGSDYLPGLTAYGKTAVRGVGDGPGDATGVYGEASTSDAKEYGVYGKTLGNNDSSFGVYGITTGSLGIGVYGRNQGTSGDGVYGIGFNGVYGETGITGGQGIYGKATGTNAWGVRGYSDNSIGVYGSTGSSSSYAGYFNGRVYTTATYQSSDRNLKKDITDLNSALAIIGKLKPKSYNFRQDGDYGLMNLPQGKHYGLIAQDVEQVLPELVQATIFDAGKAAADADPVKKATSKEISFKALNYTELIPIVIKGMQEQQQENNELQERVAKLEEMVRRLTADRNANTTTSNALFQNTPNPANGTTHIMYTLTTGTKNAQLLITDAAGKKVKTLLLNKSGSVDVNTALLSSGLYNYSLVIDGNVVETKKLVVTR